jgi:uncharacterized iron-regulated protein
MSCRTAAIGLLASAIGLAGCTSFTTGDRAADEGPRIASLLPADVLLIGEQHDAPGHQDLARHTIAQLAAARRLAAVALEMAKQGTGTAGLSPDVDETTVRAALRWQDAAWPWTRYGPVVMAAVRAGVPVLGANLPRARNAESMSDAALDTAVPAQALARLQTLVRDGHCGLLPQARIPAMTRIQIARDRSMAATLAGAVRTERTVVLVAGQNHVRRGIGVPLHLPAQVRARVLLAVAGNSSLAGKPDDLAGDDRIEHTPAVEPVDHCKMLGSRF